MLALSMSRRQRIFPSSITDTSLPVPGHRVMLALSESTPAALPSMGREATYSQVSRVTRIPAAPVMQALLKSQRQGIFPSSIPELFLPVPGHRVMLALLKSSLAVFPSMGREAAYGQVLRVIPTAPVIQALLKS